MDGGGLPTVGKREGCGVAFVPVVGVAGIGTLACVALLSSNYPVIQLHFYRITFFAELSHAVDKGGSQWRGGIRDVLSCLQWDYDSYVSLQDFFLRIIFRSDKARGHLHTLALVID